MKSPTLKSGSSQNPCFRQIGPTIQILQINVEGISKAKSQYLSKICLEKRIDIILIQETHTADAHQLVTRGSIPGYELLGATYSQVYGVATYINSTVENAFLLSTSTSHDIHEVVVKAGDLTVVNVYKPPSVKWPIKVLNSHPHPAIFLGDFNSHHTQWKYKINDPNGESLTSWAEINNVHLVFDVKDRGTFKSAAWKQEYNPDLCFVTSNNNLLPLATSRRVLSDFPKSQHRPVLLEVGTKIPLVNSTPRPRWNFQKAKWDDFKENLEKTLGWIPPISKNYERFVGAIISTGKKHIPRGYRRQYIPGWTEHSEKLYEDFVATGEQEIAEDLLQSLDAARRQKWIETTENLDFKRSSRKAWSLLRKLGGGSQKTLGKLPIKPNKIAANIVTTSRSHIERRHSTQIKRELKVLKKQCPKSSNYSSTFTTEDITKALQDLKPNKAPGFDGIHSEFLLHLGKYATTWLAKFFTNIMETGHIPRSMKRTKIIAVLKPGKPSEEPKSYRPIALLSTMYKLLERLIYNRISTEILKIIPIEQAGFRPGRSCSDQVLSLTSFIEGGYQKNLKTSAVFIDLTAAYDTVWRPGVTYKFLRAIPCKRTSQLISNMLSDRPFQVIMGDSHSKQRILNNGLPQGSVLAPLLFNLYIADIPDTKSRKFGYADDWSIATQHKDIDKTEEILTADLDKLGQFFRKWGLQVNPNKTESSCFHLSNILANRELNIHFQGNRIRFNKNPNYLGVTFDRSLIFKQHLTKVAAKIRSRNNILQKLCGTTWGSTASTLRTTALSLVYSVAEYCCSAWLNSRHTKIVDTQLNQTMRIITGTIKSTPTHWLPALSYIPPPHLRRKRALMCEFKKITENRQLPIHVDIDSLEINRLQSRHPSMRTAASLVETNFQLKSSWTQEWSKSVPPQLQSFLQPNKKPCGFDLPRRSWSRLNRIRTNHGKCGDLYYKWGKNASPACDCGCPKQTISHVVKECSLTSYSGDFSDFLNATPAALDYINLMTVDV